MVKLRRRVEFLDVTNEGLFDKFKSLFKSYSKEPLDKEDKADLKSIIKNLPKLLFKSDKQNIESGAWVPSREGYPVFTSSLVIPVKEKGLSVQLVTALAIDLGKKIFSLVQTLYKRKIGTGKEVENPKQLELFKDTKFTGLKDLISKIKFGLQKAMDSLKVGIKNLTGSKKESFDLMYIDDYITEDYDEYKNMFFNSYRYPRKLRSKICY